MERILRQSHETKDESLINVIGVILNAYLSEVPNIHGKLMNSIPQQSALFYNNCQFLAHWVTTNSDKGIPTYPALVKTLQMTGCKYLNLQISYQQKIIMSILKEFGKYPYKFISFLQYFLYNFFTHVIFFRYFRCPHSWHSTAEIVAPMLAAIRFVEKCLAERAARRHVQ